MGYPFKFFAIMDASMGVRWMACRDDELYLEGEPDPATKPLLLRATCVLRLVRSQMGASKKLRILVARIKPMLLRDLCYGSTPVYVNYSIR